jgi:hypothetical protein
VQYRRRHRLPKLAPKTVSVSDSDSLFSSSRFPASFPVVSVHRFQPKHLHSTHVTSLFTTTQDSLSFDTQSLAIFNKSRAQTLSSFQLALSKVQLNLLQHNTLSASHIRSYLIQQHTGLVPLNLPGRPWFESCWPAINPPFCFFQAGC